MKEKVAVLGSPSPIVCTVSVDVKLAIVHRVSFDLSEALQFVLGTLLFFKTLGPSQKQRTRRSVTHYSTQTRTFRQSCAALVPSLH